VIRTGWTESIKKGGVITDFIISELAEIATKETGKKVVNRMLPTLVARFNFNIGRPTKTMAVTLVADPLQRPKVLIEEIKSGLNERKEFNEERFKVIKSRLKL